MAKVHLEKLKKKYGIEDITGAKYSEIIKEIITQNNDNVNNAMYRKSNKKWQEIAKKYRKKEMRLVLPEEDEVIPKRALQIRKAAESGEFITETLRDELTKKLRESLSSFTDEKYITRRGFKAGRINPKLIEEFEKEIKSSFENYTKKDPNLKMPKNVHGIAVTEIRSAINDIKESYVQKMIDENPNLEVWKIWIHNRALSKVPRRGHAMVNNKRVKFNDFFKVPLYKEVKGSLKRIGTTMMRRPHDPTASIDQIIGCNCDYDIMISKKAAA